MNSLALCALFFVLSLWAGRRSRLQGLCAVLFVGYIYGITRANIIDTFSHFYFDSALVGYYCTQPWKALDADEARRSESIASWLQVLIGWPFLVLMLPMQTFLISMVGIRGNVFFLPALLIGARLRSLEIYKLCGFVALLNLAVFGLGLTEYTLGVEQFYPPSPTTQIIYNSNDMGGQLRVPGTFVTAHAYGGMMLITIPMLIGALLQEYARHWHRVVLTGGLLAALGGIVLTGTRTNLVQAGLLILIVLFFNRINKSVKVTLLVLSAAGIWIMMNSPSFSRMKSVLNADSYSSRIEMSVNRSFFEVVTEYPFGNGLGGGGTSIPYFLVSQLRNPVNVENEYARIALEQGIIGLLIWVSFLLWFLLRPSWRKEHGWARGQILCRIMLVCGLLTALIGTGMLTSIPASFVFFLLVGWVATEPAPDEFRLELPKQQRRRNVLVPVHQRV